MSLGSVVQTIYRSTESTMMFMSFHMSCNEISQCIVRCVEGTTEWRVLTDSVKNGGHIRTCARSTDGTRSQYMKRTVSESLGFTTASQSRVDWQDRQVYASLCCQHSCSHSGLDACGLTQRSITHTCQGSIFSKSTSGRSDTQYHNTDTHNTIKYVVELRGREHTGHIHI